MYITKMVCQAKAFLLTYSTRSTCPFSHPARTLQTVLKTIETGHLHQSFCRFLITTDKALDGYTHIVIDHHGGDTMYIPEKVTVGFHEGKRILMPEKIGVSAIAMPESEYGQIKLGFDAVNKKKNFTPVKLGNASGS